MEEKLEPFADEDYEPQVIDGWTILRLHGEKGKRKKIKADKIPKLYEAMRNGWDIDIEYAVIDGDIDIRAAELDTDDQGKLIIVGKMSFSNASFTQNADFSVARFTQTANFKNWTPQKFGGR